MSIPPSAVKDNNNNNDNNDAVGITIASPQNNSDNEITAAIKTTNIDDELMQDAYMRQEEEIGDLITIVQEFNTAFGKLEHDFSRLKGRVVQVEARLALLKNGGDHPNNNNNNMQERAANAISGCVIC